MLKDRLLNGFSRFAYSPEDGSGGGGGGDSGANKDAGGGDAGGGDSGADNTGDNAGGDSGANKDAGTGDGDKGKTGDGKDKKAADNKDAGGDGKDKKKTDDAGAEKDWRAEYAKGDAKKLARLSRFTDMNAALDALLTAQDKIRSGELAKPPGKDATPEQLKAYRDSMGIPEKPEDYDLTKIPGVQIGEDDKEAVGIFLKEMHGLNASPDVVRAAIATKYKMDEMATNALLEQDEQLAEDCTNKLRAEYGADFKKNTQILQDFLDKHIAEDIRDDFKGGRLGDGTPLFSSLSFVKFMTQMARELYPMGTITHGAGMDNIDSIQNELKEIRGYIKTNRDAYYKDEKKQARFRELLEAEERFGAKK